MNQSVRVRLQWLDNLSLIRAIFHVKFARGSSLPFFKKFHIEKNR